MNPDAAFALFHNMRADTANYYFNERELNWLSYDFLRASFNGHIEMAHEVFKNNRLLFPSSLTYLIVMAKYWRRWESLRNPRKCIAAHFN
jgi:hypothetical protein